MGDGLGLHRSTVSRIITRVTAAICRLKHTFIKFPRNEDEVQQTKEQFYNKAHFPNVLGAIDGTLVPIIAPKDEENIYVSRKGHSLNVLAVADATMKFTYVVSKFPGSTNDGYIWTTCALHGKFERGEMDGLLLGDSGCVFM